MAFIIAAVVLVGFLSSVNLVLTIGVVKRLREHAERLFDVGESSQHDVRALMVGEEVGEFEAATVDGARIHRGTFEADTVVAFLAAGCEPCMEKVPRLVEYARTAPGGRDHVLTVVVGEAEETAALVNDLTGVALVAVESHGGPLTSAFRVTAYPVVVVVGPDTRGRPVIRSQNLPSIRPTVPT